MARSRLTMWPEGYPEAYVRERDADPTASPHKVAYRARVSIGLCLFCWEKRAEGSRSCCAKHLEAQRIRQKLAFDEKVKAAQCIGCPKGASKPLVTAMRCGEHAEKLREYMRKRRGRPAQNRPRRPAQDRPAVIKVPDWEA